MVLETLDIILELFLSNPYVVQCTSVYTGSLNLAILREARSCCAREDVLQTPAVAETAQ